MCSVPIAAVKSPTSEVVPHQEISVAKATDSAQRDAVDSTHAILIRTHRLTDTSLIVHWLTEDFGLIRTVAKGARRPRSPFSGRLDLFFGAEIVFQRSRRGDLHPLREVSVHDWREGLRKAYLSFLLAGYWCRLMERVIEPEHADPVWYDLLKRALDHLETEGASRRALLHFEKETLRLLGIYEKNCPVERILGDFIGEIPDVRDDLLEKLPPASDCSSQSPSE